MRNATELPDMSPAAIAARLEELRALNLLCASLAEARPWGEASAVPDRAEPAPVADEGRRSPPER